MLRITCEIVIWACSIFLVFQKPGIDRFLVRFFDKSFFSPPPFFFGAISPFFHLTGIHHNSRPNPTTYCHCTTYSFNITLRLQIQSEFSYCAIVCALGSIQTFRGLRTLEIRYSKHFIGLRWVKARSQIFYPHVMSHEFRSTAGNDLSNLHHHLRKARGRNTELLYTAQPQPSATPR
jgi:hypothetical protein